MKEKIFELFLSECGTQQKAAEVLKISQSYFNKMRSGERTICPDKAKEITNYLYIKSNKNFSPEHLISSIEKKKQRLANCSLSYVIPIKVCPFNLDFIKTSFDKNYHQYNKNLNHEETIIIDEFNHLISGQKSYFYYLYLNKKIINACQIHLQKLINLRLNSSVIICVRDVFDIIERTKISQRVKNLSSDRRKKLFKKFSNVNNYPHIVLPAGVRTRDFIAKLFGLGSAYSYRMLKRIIAHNDEVLIEQVRREEITPHAAYQQILKTEANSSFSFDETRRALRKQCAVEEPAIGVGCRAKQATHHAVKSWW